MSWNFVYGFEVMSHRSSSCFVWFCQILNELCPFVGLGILHIGSFPHFLSTCFEVLSWNFVYVFVMMSHRSSLSFMWFHQILNELCPFFDLEYYTYRYFYANVAGNAGPGQLLVLLLKQWKYLKNKWILQYFVQYSSCTFQTSQLDRY